MTPRSFNAATVRNFVPALSGVYGLSNASNWLLIGESDNIQQTLLEHLNDFYSTQNRPTGFIFEICDRATRSVRHRRLVSEYHPKRS